jgi:hypothetical protein
MAKHRFWIERDRFVVIRERAFVLAFGRKHEAAVDIRGAFGRQPPHALFGVGKRAVVVIFLGKGFGAIEIDDTDDVGRVAISLNDRGAGRDFLIGRIGRRLALQILRALWPVLLRVRRQCCEQRQRDKGTRAAHLANDVNDRHRFLHGSAIISRGHLTAAAAQQRTLT